MTAKSSLLEYPAEYEYVNPLQYQLVSDMDWMLQMLWYQTVLVSVDEYKIQQTDVSTQW